MEIVSLEPEMAPIFWAYVNQDIPHYYFFAVDWKYNRSQTKILLALEEEQIQGMMLIYDNMIVQLRGSLEAAGLLMERLDLEKVELQSLEEHEKCVLSRYNPTWSHRMILMLLHKGQENLDMKHPVVRLGSSDSEQIAAIMRDADPEYWGSTTNENIMEGMKKGLNWFGVKIDGDPVSVCGSRVTEWAGVIGVVATHEAHRNRGYATSVVSRSLRQVLQKNQLSMIFVLSDNQPAIRVYERVGFKPYKTYFFMRGEKV